MNGKVCILIENNQFYLRNSSNYFDYFDYFMFNSIQIFSGLKVSCSLILLLLRTIKLCSLNCVKMYNITDFKLIYALAIRFYAYRLGNIFKAENASFVAINGEMYERDEGISIENKEIKASVRIKSDSKVVELFNYYVVFRIH